MAGPVVDWMERFSPTASGVDHLGMRVAGEQAYARLIDFTTTVSFRPRYFSFLCWAVQKAFLAAGGHEGALEHLIDPVVWRRTLKRCDFAMAAATLVADPAAQRIAGSRKIEKILKDREDGEVMAVRDDHLRAPHGSLDTYVGSMYNLHLLRVAGRVTRPSGLGVPLAEAFERSLRLCGNTGALASATISFEDLLLIGARCGLSRLSSEDNENSPEVRAEREALRAVIVASDGPYAKDSMVANRRHSIGLILRLHQIVASPRLHEFRMATLLDGVRHDEGITWLEMPHSYDRARSHWRIYQAHAYATFALEALLTVTIEHAFQLQPTLGEVLPTTRVVDGVLDLLVDGGSNATGGALLGHGWWNDSLEAQLVRLDAIVALRRDAEIAEPELSTTVNSIFEDHAAAAHDACLLYLLSSARMRSLSRTDGKDCWTGEDDPMRLPPTSLVDALETAVQHQQTVREFLRDAIVERVIRQHRMIALRKLAADPSRDTSELLLEAGGMIPLTSHNPGTSNPRYDNAVMVLADLGYLTPDGTVTTDGEDLLKQIARADLE